MIVLALWISVCIRIIKICPKYYTFSSTHCEFLLQYKIDNEGMRKREWHREIKER